MYLFVGASTYNIYRCNHEARPGGDVLIAISFCYQTFPDLRLLILTFLTFVGALTRALL